MTMQDFYRWERASRDTIDVKKTYIDMAGDLVAGILLSQIVYWHLPGKDGKSRLRIKKDGKLWLAKGRADWWDEIRITPKQFDRAVSVLLEKELIEKEIHRFDGQPTVHIRINEHAFLQGVNSFFTFGENGNSPLGKNEIDQRVISITETTTENTTETTTGQKDFPVEAEKPKPRPQTPELDFLLSLPNNFLSENEKNELKLKTGRQDCDDLLSVVRLKRPVSYNGHRFSEAMRLGLQNLQTDSWRVEKGHANIWWLLDVEHGGKSADARLNKWSRAPTGKDPGVAERRPKVFA